MIRFYDRDRDDQVVNYAGTSSPDLPLYRGTDERIFRNWTGMDEDDGVTAEQLCGCVKCCPEDYDYCWDCERYFDNDDQVRDHLAEVHGYLRRAR